MFENSTFTATLEIHEGYGIGLISKKAEADRTTPVESVAQDMVDIQETVLAAATAAGVNESAVRFVINLDRLLKEVSSIRRGPQLNQMNRILDRIHGINIHSGPGVANLLINLFAGALKDKIKSYNSEKEAVDAAHAQLGGK
jgi:hypothetical protein